MRLHYVVAVVVAATAFCVDCMAADVSAGFDFGLAEIDITPATAIRLSGYAARSDESVGVQQRLRGKALAIGCRGRTCILLTADCTGLSGALTGRIKSAIQREAGIAPQNVVLAASHTHSAPMIGGYLENLFGKSEHPVTVEQQQRIDRYTRELESKLVQAALAAVGSRRAALLSWGQDEADFAGNRRTHNGPVDHDLPVLKVAEPNATTRALVVGYACRCTTVDYADNVVSGDWAGYAQEYIEKDLPTSAGCRRSCSAGPKLRPFPSRGNRPATERRFCADSRRRIWYHRRALTGAKS